MPSISISASAGAAPLMTTTTAPLLASTTFFRRSQRIRRKERKLSKVIRKRNHLEKQLKSLEQICQHMQKNFTRLELRRLWLQIRIKKAIAEETAEAAIEAEAKAEAETEIETETETETETEPEPVFVPSTPPVLLLDDIFDKNQKSKSCCAHCLYFWNSGSEETIKK